MTLLYDLLFLIFALLYFPYVLWRGKWHRDFGMRFGFWAPELKTRLAAARNIWFHAVSVGEVAAVAGLVQRVKQSFPRCGIVVSTVTATGHQLAKSRLPPDVVVIYAPLDLSLSVRRYVRLINPVLYVAAETEIWPNLFYALAKSKVPVVQVNGRISDATYQRYRLVRLLLRPVLNCVNLFCVQTQLDAQRILSLGVPAGKVQVTGNLKFDDLVTDGNLKREQVGFADRDVIWTAGSTHPGEEAIVLAVFAKLLPEYPNLKLVLTPRHVERSDAVARLAKENGFDALRSSLQHQQPRRVESVLLVDTIGQLRALYQLSDMVFVGKSLTARGGQNIIEPAIFGKPIVVGPHLENFRQAMDLLRQAQGIVEVDNQDQLQEVLKNWLEHPRVAAEQGQRAKAALSAHRGATDRTFQLLSSFLAIHR